MNVKRLSRSFFFSSSENSLKKDLGYDIENNKIINSIHTFKFNNRLKKDDFEKLFSEIDKSLVDLRKNKIFLCHAGEDNEVTEKIACELNNNGYAVWYDKWSLSVGDSITDKINEGIKGSSFMGVILSEKSINKPWCKLEMNSALQLQLKDMGIKILTILIEDCEIPPLLSDIKYADFRKLFYSGIEDLSKSIQKLK